MFTADPQAARTINEYFRFEINSRSFGPRTTLKNLMQVSRQDEEIS